MKQRQFNKYFNKEKKGKCYFYKIPKYKNKIKIMLDYDYIEERDVTITFKYKKLQKSFEVKNFWTDPHVI